MKSPSSYRISRIFTLLFFVLWVSPGYASLEYSQGTDAHKNSRIELNTGRTKARSEKVGFFQKIMMLKTMKKALKKTAAVEDDKASPLARAALILFIGSFVLGFIPVTFFSVVSSLAFLISVICAFIVLFSESNRKSKAIAKTVLIIAGILLVLSIAVILVILGTWAG